MFCCRRTSTISIVLQNGIVECTCVRKTPLPQAIMMMLIWSWTTLPFPLFCRGSFPPLGSFVPRTPPPANSLLVDRFSMLPVYCFPWQTEGSSREECSALGDKKLKRKCTDENACDVMMMMMIMVVLVMRFLKPFLAPIGTSLVPERPKIFKTPYLTRRSAFAPLPPLSDSSIVAREGSSNPLAGSWLNVQRAARRTWRNFPNQNRRQREPLPEKRESRQKRWKKIPALKAQPQQMKRTPWLLFK